MKFLRILAKIFFAVLGAGLIFAAVTAWRDGEIILAVILGVVAFLQFGLALPKKRKS